jgi:hypothetical protein
MVPVESFIQLTALQHLGLTIITTAVSEQSQLGMLGQLTSLQVGCADWTDWSIFEGCAGLRTLHLGGASSLIHAAWVYVGIQYAAAPWHPYAHYLVEV